MAWRLLLARRACGDTEWRNFWARVTSDVEVLRAKTYFVLRVHFTVDGDDEVLTLNCRGATEKEKPVSSFGKAVLVVRIMDGMVNA